jgi:dynactin-4
MAKRKSVMPGIAEEGGRQPEVGKVWERGRNWTSVILEVVPGLLPSSTGSGLAAAVEKAAAEEKQADDGETDESGDDDIEREDEDVVEIPVFVRVNYETEPGGATDTPDKREGAAKESREVGFWCVLGVGRIVG